MEIIYLTHPYDKNEIPSDDVVLALGFFDGLHKAHQKVIQTAKRIAKSQGKKLAVMSFDRHPSVLFSNKAEGEYTYISPLERKIELLEMMDIDYFYVVTFNHDFASLNPQEFVDEYIVCLHASVVVAGFDYTYGRPDIANMDCLDYYGKNRFDIVMVPEQRNLHGKIGSTSVRKALVEGEVSYAEELLGYHYQISGVVEHGFGRGSALLGYPTANTAVQPDVLVPKQGVYVTRVKVRGEWYKAMTSIGLNPTFNDVREPVIEVHILDFNQDIYGDKITIEWRKYLRPELKFETINQLIRQLKTDEEDTRMYFSEKQ
ncbi:riboflavin kinase / FMN adenylyltransferase [Granulicatella balaenopterae]|uniref:Riboflavin biosynthesis protein n=1 Tax=Granulicatella balaenopterae TaxID=137733 RepID=A0A1H9I339_9LACT|nr:riboflavin biosynthesis protein RibF [Granulicatella balaenopterae]SEQ68912.1 riboflavin kinase / FMN adenylyltransferase [Granulicatella balaenopterae]